MADNVTLDAGSGGDTIAADDVSGVKYQLIQLVTGADGGAKSLVTGSNGLPITDASGSITVDNAGTFAVQAAQSGTWTVQPGNTANTTAWLVTGTGGTFPVTDSGGSLTVDVDGTVAATQSGTWSVRAQDGSGNALTSAARGSERALSVQVVDASGNQVASFGGGTQYTEGDTDASITGTALLWEDTSDTLRAVSAAKPLPIGDAGGSITVDNGGTFATQAAQSGTWTVQPGNTANTTAWLVTDTPATSGGLSISRVISAGTTNATSVKGSAGQVYSIAATNVNAAARYLKLYNKATAPTVGTDTPVMTLLIPGNTAGAGLVWNIDKGIAFGTGIALAITGAATDADTTAVSANENIVTILYK